MSSALYDAALCSVDFAQLLPGLFNRDDNQHRTPSPPRRAKDATPHRAPKTTPHDHTATATRSEDTGAGLMARKHAHTNKGKHDGKKAGAKAKSNGATRPPNSSSQPAPPPPSTAAGLTAIASPSPSSSSSYPQTFYNDDLSTAPLFPPAFKRTDSRPLPPLDLEDRDLDTRFPAASNSPGSAARDVAGRIHPADRDADGRLSWRSADEEDYSYDSSLSSSLSYSDDDYDEDADEEDSGGGADDEEDLEEEEDDSDERRPFPDPRLAKQQKYLRRSPGDDDKLDVSPPTHVEHAHPPRLDTNLAISHIAAVRSAYATPLDSPLVSPSLVPSHKTSILPVPSNLPSPTYDHPSHSVDEGHYTSLPNSGVERTYVPPSAYTSEVSDSESESDWRGRNRHPRLLWRSKLDPSSLRVLDAHHARVRGGPLPRLVVDEEGRVVLSASGVEREREHAGLEEGEGKERVRRRRGRMDKEGKARSWSVVGRRWSRAVEKCGL